MGGGPIEGRGQVGIPRLDRHGREHELRLAAIAMRWHDHPAGDRVRDLGAPVEPGQVQAEIDAGRRAGGREHLTVADVQHGRIEVYRRVQAAELVGPHPMRRGAAAIQ